MKITKKAGKQEVRLSKSEWETIGKKAGWYDTSDGPTDPGNAIGDWDGGWLNGEWKCPQCGVMIGKNLKNESPYSLVAHHQSECEMDEYMEDGMSDVEADADTLSSAGWGTDEDYGSASDVL